ncbi:hypothetical protein EXE48_11970 [Halorubrum sp. ASP1]|uniref:hypothetical protein n=1 Tax=Halorubrum sp. ASP1 TaxID=2518114 RepID=UPI0010F5A1E6|nr:hypothetical protein [Halorubrum sp. ASP1]TKX60681.1 hypothetical protein EXE48_11970 [Halorubrum sp. ASP1]
MARKTHYQQLKEYYEEKVDTEKPCSVGNTLSVSRLSGVPEWAADYPVTGQVTRVEPKGVGTHNIVADWFVRVRFDSDQPTGVAGTTTELFCVGGSRRSWADLPVVVTDD